MAIQRKSIPEFIQWDQQSILSAISALTGALSALTNLTGNPASDTKGVVTRNVRDHEIVGALNDIHEVLERINMTLGHTAGVTLNPGETL